MQTNKMTTIARACLSAAVLALPVPAWSQTVTTTFQQGTGGYTGGSDRTISTGNATANGTTGTMDMNDGTSGEFQYFLLFDSIVGSGSSQIPSGATILDAAAAAGVDLRSYCGGNCSCGTCRVEIPERSRRALSRRTGNEEMVLGMDAAARGDRLACQAQVLGDVDVIIPEWF